MNNLNPILKWFKILRPKLWEAPDFEKVAAVLSYMSNRPMNKKVPVDEACEALIELIPEQREFWLRVEATDKIRFIEGLTACFKNTSETYVS